MIKRKDANVEKYVAMGKPVVQFQKTGRVPAGVCVSITTPRAQDCPLRDICFSSKHPPGSLRNPEDF